MGNNNHINKPMKKADREKIFYKYGGRCAYCGCELTKGWHVDHIEPNLKTKNTWQQKFTSAEKYQG